MIAIKDRVHLNVEDKDLTQESMPRHRSTKQLYLGDLERDFNPLHVPFFLLVYLFWVR